MNELFKIFRVKEEEAKKISASPDEPHQHDFEELIILSMGFLFMDPVVAIQRR